MNRKFLAGLLGVCFVFAIILPVNAAYLRKEQATTQQTTTGFFQSIEHCKTDADCGKGQICRCTIRLEGAHLFDRVCDCERRS